MKDCLQLEGDIHVLGERINQSNYDLSELIKRINARMDSFVNQITDFKKSIHESSESNMSRMISEIEKYDKHFDYACNLKSEHDDIIFRLDRLECQDKRMIEDISNNSKFFSDLSVKFTTKVNEDKYIESRLINLENYFGKYNFESILDELNKLDDEYQKKVTEIVTRLSSKKTQTIELEGLFKTIDDCEFKMRTANCLKAENFRFIGDIICHPNIKGKIRDFSFGGLMRIPNLGRRSYQEISDFISLMGYKSPIVCENYWLERKSRTGELFEFEIYP